MLTLVNSAANYSGFYNSQRLLSDVTCDVPHRLEIRLITWGPGIWASTVMVCGPSRALHLELDNS